MQTVQTRHCHEQTPKVRRLFHDFSQLTRVEDFRNQKHGYIDDEGG